MKKKILIFINSIDVGGVRSVLISLLNSLDYTIYDVKVISMFETAEFESLVTSKVKYKKIFPFRIRGYSHFLKIISPSIMHKLFIKEKFDVEVACMDGISARVISGSKDTNSKKILWFHSDIETNNATTHCFKNIEERKKIYSLFNSMWFVSKGSEEGFANTVGELGVEKNVLYNPFDIAQIIERSNEKVYGLQESDYFTFCTVGRLSKEKSYDMLIMAFKEVNLINNKTRLLIVGNGDEYTFLEELVAKYNLKEYVFLLGEKDNPLPYIKISDCYVCSSKTEALSTSVIEATIIGIPTVTTNCSGMYDILGESEYGLIVDYDYNKLAAGMITMIDNKALYSKYKNGLFERSQMFSKEVFQEKFKQII